MRQKPFNKAQKGHFQQSPKYTTPNNCICISLPSSDTQQWHLRSGTTAAPRPPPPSAPPQTHTDLLVGQLEVVVGDPPVEVLQHVVADLMDGLWPQLVLDAAVGARRPPQHRVEEGQVREAVGELMLVLAPEPAADPGAADLPVAAQRRLHVAHHGTVVTAVERLHGAVVEQVEGLQEAAGGGQRRGQQHLDQDGGEGGANSAGFHHRASVWRQKNHDSSFNTASASSPFGIKKNSPPGPPPRHPVAGRK